MPSSSKTRAPSPYADSSGPQVFALPASLRRRLSGLRRRQLAVSWTEGTAFIIGVLLVLFGVQMLADWWIDLPRAVRALLLLADLTAAGWFFYHRILTPWRRRLTSSTAALRAEKTFPQLRGTLISAVQFSQGANGGVPVSPGLLADVVARAAEGNRAIVPSKIIPAGRAFRLTTLAILLLAAAAAFVVLDHAHSGPLIRRLLLSNQPLPTRTIVVPVTHELLPAFGSDATLIARATGDIPNTGRVHVTYTGGKEEDLPVTVDATQKDTFKLVLPNIRAAMTYRFYLGDGHSPIFDIRPLTPPALASLKPEEVYPAYTGLGTVPLTPASLNLLEGSHLRLQITSTVPLKGATIKPQGADAKGIAFAAIPMTVDSSKNTATGELPIPAKGLTGFSVALVSTEGVPSTGDTVYSVQIVPDAPPVIKLLSPASQAETITLRATPLVALDATDDFGLTKLAFCYQITAPDTGGDTTAEAVTPPIIRIPFTIDGPAGRQHVNYPWKLSGIQPLPPEGSTISYWIEATDNNTVTGPGLTATTPQQFTLVSSATKSAEILKSIGDASQALKTLSDTQRALGTQIDTLLTPQTPAPPPTPAPTP